ncbi:FkbM family methyltransferase [Planktothrix sp. FACHB-1355]|uniref:FkbM family methyltransferase n=1 Tax=Aerosakkonema funiforme FACHB-1375 TaxID=2949571 RepID=A0A926VAE5_9CYAN|nr:MULTISPECIES: FkbM family methyltransferase [Oscillatoriales]MBD2179748.1 FkbM family methyltransferase [Aerosakkonema funiforme FACHB-1375]MBD3560451.1 FkbM family methyltransferase [Planktothrix sp. FACHB-1355]
MQSAFQEVQSIDFVDIGCSGSLEEKWEQLFPLLSYTGFDPNSEECQRLSSLPHPYKSAKYFPYAIAGEEGTKTIYLTERVGCSSLLRPNHQWLNRFSYHDLFKETGTSSVVCTTLNALANKEGLKADIIKIDTQGLELPILQSGDLVLKNAFCVETETGFLENYIGETTYAQIDEFMRSKGFMMFDIKIYKVGRKNSLIEYGKQQPLWCEALWLFDLIGQGKNPSLEEALKYLTICRAMKCFDYGLELSRYFKDLGIVDRDMLNYLEKPENWIIKPKPPTSTLGKILRWLPEDINKRLMFGLKQIIEE